MKRPVGGVPTTLRTVRYTYYKTGDVSNITVKDEFVSGVTPGDPNDYDWYSDLAFHYITNGSLRYAVTGKWQLDPNDVPDPDSYVPISAKEFRFDSPRARYLAVEYDCHGSTNQANWTVVDNALHWTDYTGDTPATDAEVTAAGGGAFDIDNVTHYFGLAGQQPADASSETYYHGDLIASTTMTTDEDGGSVALPATTAYTAFGELVTGYSEAATRYQYAGGFGYESGLLALQGANTTLAPITLQHLGARWYQPSIGRFVQRDPIGLYGGKNVYAYASQQPTDAVDPSGLWDEGYMPPGVDSIEKLPRLPDFFGFPAPGPFTGTGVTQGIGIRVQKAPRGQLGAAAGKTSRTSLWWAKSATKTVGNATAAFLRGVVTPVLTDFAGPFYDCIWLSQFALDPLGTVGIDLMDPAGRNSRVD